MYMSAKGLDILIRSRNMCSSSLNSRNFQRAKGVYDRSPRTDAAFLLYSYVRRQRKPNVILRDLDAYVKVHEQVDDKLVEEITRGQNETHDPIHHESFLELLAQLSPPVRLQEFLPNLTT